jgi:hypothetical protein
MRLKFFLLFSFLMLAIPNMVGQEENMKWTVGVGGSFIDFNQTEPFENESINIQVPNLSVTRYLSNGFLFGVHLTNTGVSHESFSNEYDLLTVDLNLRYDFNTSENIIVPYITAGLGSFVKNNLEKTNKESTTSMNLGAGCTFWVFPKLGLHLLGIYRLGTDETIITEHTQFSVGLVFGFGASSAKVKRSPLTENSSFCF